MMSMRLALALVATATLFGCGRSTTTVVSRELHDGGSQMSSRAVSASNPRPPLLVKVTGVRAKEKNVSAMALSVYFTRSTDCTRTAAAT
jgi:hypothetical protein